VRQKIMSADKLVAEAEGVCVVMDQTSRKPFAIPDTTRAALEPLLRAP